MNFITSKLNSNHTQEICSQLVISTKDPYPRMVIHLPFFTGYWLPGYKLKTSWATGLHLAVMYGHMESLMVLLNHKATINCRPNGKAAIHVACEVANVECLKILCKHGAKINCFSMSGHAPLHFCTTKTSVPCAQQLIWRGKSKHHSDCQVPPRIQSKF